MATKRSWVRVLGLGGLTAVAGSLLWANQAGYLAQAGASTAPPVTRAVTLAAVAVGYVDAPSGTASLYPLVAGRVRQVPVQEGEQVKTGAVVVQLDDALPRFRLQEASAALHSAQVQLDEARRLPEKQKAREAAQQAAIEAARQRLAGAQDVLKRKQELVRVDQLDAIDAETAQAAVQGAAATVRGEEEKLRALRLADPAADIAQAEANVQAAQAKRDEAQRAVRECQLRAPSAGTVLRLFVQPGDVLGQGPTRPVVQFCPAGPRVIRAEVEQEFAGRVAVGQRATVEDDTTAGQAAWHGKVTRISDWYARRRSVVNDPRQYNDERTMECIVTLDPGGPPLRIGQRVRVLFRDTAEGRSARRG